MNLMPHFNQQPVEPDLRKKSTGKRPSNKDIKALITQAITEGLADKKLKMRKSLEEDGAQENAEFQRIRDNFYQTIKENRQESQDSMDKLSATLDELI